MEKSIIEHHENLKSIHLANPLDKDCAPLIVVFPAFEGHSEFILTYSHRLVDQGFQVFIADMYGNGQNLTSLSACFAAVEPFLSDRELVRKRALENVNAAIELTDLEPYEIGVMGFCFGGMCTLETARSGFAAPAFFAAHSSLIKSDLITTCSDSANIMLAQGYADPLVSAKELEGFSAEMLEQNWSCMFYGNTKHSFTDHNVGHMDPIEELKIGRQYQAISAQQCFQQAVLFFENHLC